MDDKKHIIFFNMLRKRITGTKDIIYITTF